MSKTLCKLSKASKGKRDLKKISEALSEPKHVCEKCLRVANKKKFLCKPESLSELGQAQ